MKSSSRAESGPKKRAKTEGPVEPANEYVPPGPPLKVFVFGAGQMCELGLGPRATEVKRPRLNPLLPADEVGITQIAAGGAHCVAVDKEGRLWSWGQNDSGALGRSTKIADEDLDEDDDLNPKESTPGKVQGVSAALHFKAVGATDNLSAAITTSGRLYAWGTFIDDSIKMFRPGVEFQTTPWHVSSIRGATALAGGKDHLLILDKKGNVYAWGTGGTHQLGVSVSPNLRTKVFGPIKVPKLKDIVSITAGDYQSFAIDSKGTVYSWGLNNFAQCGHGDLAGNGAVIESPTAVPFPEPVEQVASGNHHTIFLTKSGKIYTIGETNFNQLGVKSSDLPQSTVREASGAPSYSPEFIHVTTGEFEDEETSLPKFKFVVASSDHSLAISAKDGSTWSWGFGESYQLGHGRAEDDQVPTRIKNTATTGVDMIYAGTGGQYSVLAAAAN